MISNKWVALDRAQRRRWNCKPFWCALAQQRPIKVDAKIWGSAL